MLIKTSVELNHGTDGGYHFSGSVKCGKYLHKENVFDQNLAKGLHELSARLYGQHLITPHECCLFQ